MIALLATLAMAQDLPPTTCDDETQLCQIHKDRLATLVGKAKSLPELELKLTEAADKIDDLANELEKTNELRDVDGQTILDLTEKNTVLSASEAKAKRQRNIAYIILGGSAAALAGGVYLGTKL